MIKIIKKSKYLGMKNMQKALTRVLLNYAKEIVELKHKNELNRIRKERYKSLYEESVKDFNRTLFFATMVLRIQREEMILNVKHQFG